jgi:glycosyltransferase involved in cell wall biosynthesis
MLALSVVMEVELMPQVNISDQELVEILNRASMMIYAPRLEPFGLAPLEAGACGVPVVAVAEGGVRETVVDGVTGILVRSDPAEAAALTRLRSDPALARRLGANARVIVKDKWSFEASIDRIEAHLRKDADRIAPGSSPDYPGRDDPLLGTAAAD